MKLSALKKEHMNKILEEREKILETLRTPYLVTKEMQFDWYEKEICNRDSKTRYFSIMEEEDYKIGCDFHDGVLMDHGLINIAMGGIENISWENSTGEISLLVFQEYTGKGYGSKAVDLILNHAFNSLNLNSVWGECYYSSGAVEFWKKIIKQYSAYSHDLPLRKYYNGKYWSSLYFVFEREKYVKHKQSNI